MLLFPGPFVFPLPVPAVSVFPARPRSSSRRLSASPVPHRRRSRSPVHASPALPLDQSPGPATSRLSCTVLSCPDHAHPSHGWVSFHTMRPHIEAHLSGQLMGDVPSDWLRSQGFGTCEVCQRIPSLRFNGRCPSCFHVMMSSHSSPSSSSRLLAEEHPASGTFSTADHEYGHRYHSVYAMLGPGASLLLLLI